MTTEIKLVPEKIKLQVGNYIYPVQMYRFEGRLYFQFPFNKNLMAEIKCMAGSKFHFYQETEERKKFLTAQMGSAKIWSITDNQRNWFQLNTLMGKDMFARYDSPLKPIEPRREGLRANQKVGLQFTMTRHYCILAAEMGTGKTLVAIETMEQSGFEDWWYVAPKGVMKEIERQLRYWKSTVRPKLMTYEGLTKEMKNWAEGRKCPGGVIFDESSRTKNPFAVRSQASQALANGIRADWGDHGFVILMSGSPAPKAPIDWWSQCEIACPGFLREGDVDKFKYRLGIFDESQSAQGQKFLKKVAWRDDEKRCGTCGFYADHIVHDLAMAEAAGEDRPHIFVKSTNEVSDLYKRMEGLVLVQFKKDCADLPDKQYRIVECPPSKAMLRAASSITNRTKSAAQALILLRELSDGFQYQDEPDGEIDCNVCAGTGECDDFVIKDEYIAGYENNEFTFENAVENSWVSKVRAACYVCDASGKVPKYIRETQEVECPKEEALRDLLDSHYDDGRLVVYGGFTGSINRICRIATAEGWEIIRVDGRGWAMAHADGTVMHGDALEIFQELLEEHPRVCFIGQPGAAGMGLTLTASKSIVYYSNDFNAESRIQSEDRIHRLGMDVNKGATIYDLIHLPTDMLVLNNLKAKRRLQSMTMGQVAEALKIMEAADERII